MSQHDCPEPETASPLLRHASLWLHGAGLAGDTWRGLTAGFPLAQIPDLPGHGCALRVATPRVETYAEAVADRLQPGTVVIGHSLGGMVALELAARAGSKVGALVLIEAVPTVRDRLCGRISAGGARGLFTVIPTSWLVRLAGKGEAEGTRAELRRQLLRMDPAGISDALTAASLYDGRPRLAEIAIPTLVVVGAKNTATLHGAALLARGIRGAEHHVLPGGHMLHTDIPAELLGCMETFLDRALPG
ncbi:MAG: alpha/beta hydrolase [Pseudomonadota bacterium]